MELSSYVGSTAALRRGIVIGACIIGAVAVVAAFGVAADQRNWIPFLAANQPVTADQLRTTLTDDGWSELQITEGGSYLHAVGRKHGQVIWMTVDAKTGKRMFDDDVTY